MRFNMANDLSNLCCNLSLIEKEKTRVEIEVGAIEGTILCDKCCLLGKVVADKPLSIDAFYNIMLKIWKVARSICISDVGANMFVIEFQSMHDLLKVKQVLKDFDGYTHIQEMLFDKKSF